MKEWREGRMEARQLTFTIQEVSGVKGVPVPLCLEARRVKVLADHMQVQLGHAGDGVVSIPEGHQCMEDHSQ